MLFHISQLVRGPFSNALLQPKFVLQLDTASEIFTSKVSFQYCSIISKCRFNRKDMVLSIS